MEPHRLETLRRWISRMNRAMVMLWRLGLGRLAGVWPHGFGRLMVIEHIGRATGRSYRSPVNYTAGDDGLYCIAAFGARTDWYRNVLAAAHAAVWLPDGRWEVAVEDASNAPNRLDLVRRVLVDSGFAAPLFGLHPRRLSDDDLEAATADYRLLRFRPLRRAPSAAGPNDLAWMWWPLVGVVVITRWRRRGRPATVRSEPGGRIP
jgi:deazaflavin-dependent oxidoreductase (nitroreductase family)